MSDLESRLRAGLAADLTSLPDAGTVAGEVRKGVRRRRTRQGIGAGLVATVVVVAVVASLSGGNDTHTTGPISSPSPTASATAGPAGADGEPMAVGVADGKVFTLGIGEGCKDCSDLSVRSVASVSDGTGTWTRQQRFPVVLFNLAFTPSGRDGYAWLSQLWATHDGGTTWAVVPGAAGGTPAGNGMNVYVTSRYVFEVTSHRELLRAPVGGGAWTRLKQPSVDPGDPNGPGLMTIGDQVGTVVDDGGSVDRLYTSDDGVAWGAATALTCPAGHYPDQLVSLGTTSFLGCGTPISTTGRDSPQDHTIVFRSVGGGAFEQYGDVAGRGVRLYPLAPDRLITARRGVSLMTPTGTTPITIDPVTDAKQPYGTVLSAVVPLDTTGTHALLITSPTGLGYTTSDGGMTWQPLS